MKRETDGAAGGDAGSPQPWIVPVYLLLGVAGVAPFLLFEHPRMVDLPNHWARLVVECAGTASPLRQMYRVDFSLVPNLAIDLVNVALCGIAGPKAVLIGSFVAAQAIVLAAVASIQRSLWGRLTPMALLAPALTINLASVLGYWNYLVGAALGLAMIAIMLARRARPGVWPLLAWNILGVAIFLSHVFAALFAAVLLFAYALGNWFQSAPWPKRVVHAGLFTLGACLAPLVCAALSERADGALSFDYSLKGRIVIAPFGGLYPPVDIAVTILVGIALIRLVATRTLSVGSAMRLPMAAAVALCVVIPGTFGATSLAVDIDARLAVSAMAVVFAATAIAPPARRAAWLVLLLAISVAAARGGAVIAEWPRYGRDARETRALLAGIPPGATLISAIADDPGSCPAAPWSEEPYYHLGSFATIDRAAFHALTFTGKGMQPIRAQGRYEAAASPPYGPVPTSLMLALADGPASQMLRRPMTYAIRWPATFDYVLYHHFGCAPNFAPDRLTLLGSGRVSSLLAVRKPGG